MPVHLQSKGFFSDQCLNAFTLNIAITFQSANILFKSFQNPAKVSSSVPPKDSKAVKSLRSLQVATHSCPTFCRTSSTSSTGSAILNDLSNSFELLHNFHCSVPSNRLPGLPMSTGLFTAHVHIPNCFKNPIGKSWNKLEQVAEAGFVSQAAPEALQGRSLCITEAGNFLATYKLFTNIYKQTQDT